MTEVVPYQQTNDPRDVVHRAAQLLAQGHLIALPTDTVYVVAASALQAEAVEKMAKVFPDSQADESAPLAQFAVRSRDELEDYIPEVSDVVKRLMRRCWPGPITLSLPTAANEGLLGQLPERTRQAVTHTTSGRDPHLWCRMPDHPFIDDLQSLMKAPLVLSQDRFSGSSTCDGLISQVGDHLAMAIDDGDTQYGLPATAVEVDGEQWQILSEGAVSANLLKRLTGRVYLFVCTGNTCRSPMAEGIFRKLAAERIGCSQEELADRGILVVSAGLAAHRGSPASPESVEAVRGLGVDLVSHSSQPLTSDLLDQSDHVFTMTQSHLDSILIARPDAADRVRMLTQDNRDVPDPIGGTQDDYIHCFQEIERQVRAIVETIPQP
ncbi:arsenate reductase/protein-tyrosine-phosphatase family protein [Thalassoroseus pseudoceratinae]|uniref:arsenate reductase/protein-tyrosine-phosphatase family protein n=1 Tax=Thalassoroseus pseudoceratinae TaxID=2713176 RepID=UPI0014219251|nr:Sua5/YciO/YrdC/YwlC family protein [Thalassoroseus pseudoceratinae]